MAKIKLRSAAMTAVLVLSLLSGCGTNPAPEETGSAGTASAQVASAEEMAAPEQVGEEGMEPINGEQVNDGTYDITVDSSSRMFHITSCELTVQDGKMSAVMTMGGTGYLYVFMGTGEQAVQADESEYIGFEQTDSGEHTFTVPVEALDKEISCTAFSKNKKKWYDRTLVFRADSLPTDALSEAVRTTPESLQLQDGTYTVEVTLTGGSGRATVSSPAELVVADGTVTARLVWSSPNYDYMKVDGVQYNPVNTEGNAAFDIPVTVFDYKMPVSADTTAMSTPHEIEYFLYFDSSSIKAK
ncbi:hypothetical protein [Butyricicoccus sp.]|uniref:hypothetical protein n=1 Tax=Butyricicoccus sp. TaxID=2049021 RepID=UPI003F186914